ncbi:MAG: right-handed parallel beta-helix repeat-containing protein [Myxococcota bacterium]
MWCWLSTAALAGTYEVGPSSPYPTIFDALKDATSGQDTILVHPGVYEGPLQLEHDVTITSTDGPELTTIVADTSGYPSPAITVLFGLRLTITGFTIDGRGVTPGIYIEAGDVFADQLVLYGGRDASIVAFGADLVVTDSTFTVDAPSLEPHVYLQDSVVEFDGVTFVKGLGQYGGAGSVFDTEATFRGCTFTDNDSIGDGGALYFDQGVSGSSTTIEDCWFEGNRASAWGGGFIQYGGKALTVTGTTFVDNTADQGSGAFHVSGIGAFTVADATLDGNRSVVAGGAVTVYNTGASTILRSRFTDNHTDGEGGAVDFVGSPVSAEIGGNTFCGNEATGPGGALHLEPYVSLNATVHHNVFVGNIAGEGGGAMRVVGSDVAFHQNTVVDTHTDGRGALFVDGSSESVMNGNVFVDTEGAAAAVGPYASLEPSYTLLWGNDQDLLGTANSEVVKSEPGFVSHTADDCGSDLRPAPGSAMIDAGDPAFQDDDGSPADLGAYGGPGATAVVDVDGDGGIVEDCAPYDPTSGVAGPDTPGDGLDPDCDGLEACYVDADGDGVGSNATAEAALGCDVPGYAAVGGDCDDADPALNTGGCTETTGPTGTSPTGTGDPTGTDPDAAELPPSWFCATGGPAGGAWPIGWAAAVAAIGRTARRRSARL